MDVKKEILVIEGLVTGYGQHKNFVMVPGYAVSLTAYTGEMISLLGVNGSGKSTLLKSIPGIIKAKEGKINVAGKNPYKLSNSEVSRIISTATTEILSFAYITVFDFVALGRYVYTNIFGKLHDDDINVIHSSLADTNLLAIRDKYVFHLSDGEKQRAIIARTLAQDTPLILLDEPTAFLDIPNKHEILYMLRNLAVKRKKTIIFSTHDIHAALQLSDKIILLGSRELIYKTPDQIIAGNDLPAEFNSENIVFDKNLTNFVFKNI